LEPLIKVQNLPQKCWYVEEFQVAVLLTRRILELLDVRERSIGDSIYPGHSFSVYKFREANNAGLQRPYHVSIDDAMTRFFEIAILNINVTVLHRLCAKVGDGITCIACLFDCHGIIPTSAGPVPLQMLQELKETR
jgi:hypothetical protein